MFQRGKTLPSRILRMFALIILLCGANVARAQEDAREELDEGLSILGIFVGPDEKAVTDVLLENGKFLLPAQETLDALAIRVREEDGVTFLDTPIGSIEVTGDFRREIDGIEFVSEDFLNETLSVPVRFDVEFYAIFLEPPWTGEAAEKAEAPPDVEIEPDVSPPIIGMTSVHGDVFTTFSDAADEIGVSTRLELNGHAFGGVWALSI